MTTFVGTTLTYVFLGRYLAQLKNLSNHMDNVDRRNLSETFDINSNIKEISSLTDSFNKMINKLKKSFELQKDFSSYVAHELKNPLAILRAKIDLFKNEPFDEESTKKLVDTVSNQVDRLNNIINKILELADIERIKLNERISLAVLIEDLIFDFEDLNKDNININFEIKNSDDFEIIGNYTLIYQAFFNIVDNAIKYNNEGGEVHILLESTKENVEIQISDNVIGIDDKDVEFIFTPFFRGNNIEKLSRLGIGMGLAFSKKVFEHHKAQIRVSQNFPIGTSFNIIFEKEKI